MAQLWHARFMQITDTFAATVAVAIPVLMLAATGELGSLYGAAVQQSAKQPVRIVTRVLEIEKLTERIRQQAG